MLIHRYEVPERFVAGTVGEPGDRTFFLQAREGIRLTSVALEKEQVLVLAERIDNILERTDDEAASATVDITDTEPLDQPIEEEFRVGTMTLAWDEAGEVVVLEAFAATDTEDEEATEALVVHLSRPMASAFASRAQRVISAGREPCQFCGQPLSPAGHLCPRANGYKRIPPGPDGR
ncbi:MAG: DUF3090 family protein [Nocardioidaceae bacterium]